MIERIAGIYIEKWQRKLIRSKGSYYINIPKSIVTANAKKHGSTVYISKVYNEKNGKILVTLEFG